MATILVEPRPAPTQPPVLRRVELRAKASRPYLLFWSVLAMAIIIRVGWSLAAWDPGSSALFADDFDRVGLALLWEQDPYLIPPGPLLWVPLHSWVLGLAYLATGSLFSSNPMALAAIVNTAAVLGTGALVGWSAWMIFRSRWAALTAAAIIVFSPWAFFVSISGLSEPLYFLTVAAIATAYVAWINSKTVLSLYAGSAAALLATTARYEGWWLAAAWCLLVGVQLWRRGDLTSRTLPALALPAVFPIVWLMAGLFRHGDPLFFRSIVSETADRVALGPAATYYPAALVHAAPVILILGIITVWTFRSMRLVRALAALVAVHFLLFYASSLVANGRGLVPERFVFAFAVGLAPLTGGIAVLTRRLLRPGRMRTGAAVVLAATVGLVSVVRITTNSQIEEWSPAEDLIEAARWIGDSYSGDPIVLSAPPEQIQIFTSLLGNRVRPATTDLDAEVRAFRVPIQELTAGSSVGSWLITGLDGETSPPPCNQCERWSFTDETGRKIPLPASPYLPLRFGADNPPAGAVATISRPIDHPTGSLSGRIELRALNGHGVLTGRIRVKVAVDGSVVFDADVGSENRWYSLSFDAPQGNGESVIEVALVAQPGIEQDWGWGRTVVLVRHLEFHEHAP